MLHTGETGAAFNVALYRAMLGQLSSHQTGLVVQGKTRLMLKRLACEGRGCSVGGSHALCAHS